MDKSIENVEKEFKRLNKQNEHLQKRVEQLKKDKRVLIGQVQEQDEYIKRVRDVLRFCAMNNVGTYYQQESARKMLIENVKIVWSNHNPDGTCNDKERRWIYNCAEGRKKDSGQKALDELDKQEKELFLENELPERYKK